MCFVYTLILLIGTAVAGPVGLLFGLLLCILMALGRK